MVGTFFLENVILCNVGRIIYIGSCIKKSKSQADYLDTIEDSHEGILVNKGRNKH